MTELELAQLQAVARDHVKPGPDPRGLRIESGSIGAGGEMVLEDHRLTSV